MNARISLQPLGGYGITPCLVQPTADQLARVARDDARVLLASELRAMLAGRPLCVSIRTEKLAEIIDALEA